MGDCDDTEILLTERTIQTANTDDLGIQTSKEAISQPLDQSKTVIPKMTGTNDSTTTIVIFIVILNDRRHYFLKIRFISD